MARSKAFDRERAIEQVMFEVWSNGYPGTSVKSLSELLGITRSSFYNAFGSIQALMVEVLDYYASYTPLTQLIRAKQGDPIKPLFTNTFKQLCQMRAKDTQRKGCLAMNCIAELTGKDEQLQCHISEQLSVCNDMIEQLLKWGVEQKEISAEQDIQGLALAVTNLFVGTNVMSKAIHQEEKLWKAASTTLDGLGLLEK